MSKKNVIFDATLLTSVMTCGRFADLRFGHQLGSASGKSNSLEVGSIVHKFFEVTYRNLSRGMDRVNAINHGYAAAELYIKGCQYCTDFVPCDKCDRGKYSVESTDDNTDVMEMICEHCNGVGQTPRCGHPVNEYPGVHNTPPENTSKPQRVGWQWALQTAVDYFEYYKNDHWVSLEVETVKRKIIYEDDEIRVMWKGKLDWIVDTNQGIYPVDHKTMKQNRDVVSLNNQFMGQCFLMDTKTMFVNKVGFQTSLKPEEKFKRVGINYTTERLHEWQSEIVPYWAYQFLSYDESGYYPPNFTQCEGKFGPCMFQNICSNNTNMRADIIRNEFVVQPKWDIDNVED